MCDQGRGQRVLLRCGKVALKGPTLVVCANRCVRQLCRMTSQKMADGVRQRLALITDTLTKWRFSTAWYGTVRHGSVRYGTGRFAFPPQFSTSIEWAGLFTRRYNCAASTAVTSS